MEDLPTLLSSSAVFRAPAAHKLTGMELFDDNDDDMRASAATLSFPEVNASAKTELRSLTVSLEVLQPPLQCTKCHSCSFARASQSTWSLIPTMSVRLSVFLLEALREPSDATTKELKTL
ncbi:hypothetical protein Pcac1_g1007 [Phytophthora cactorum]|uniref:Uncharacterized protein n=1 Tax=Phytophthora cactorum TaxID=29920 RepID=A0A8T0YXM5_9STRA|nr:hypothetical protein Pcac1_g1007 [Phytophthora cactorum]KAG2818033.1 hypothetical protein PC112_g12797 [Phytophthora cactorum]KAG2854435.1 hypothetical protein PC113_g13310 [Phytophthora cactorum]KAG2899738.1 hypothetical protein PC114_g13807 [Phytophthora cactorum]KAG2931202.1 hypothetical protein PC117_g13543 [Phytophthora cactorum]